MKRYQAKRSKYPFHPGVENFSFHPGLKGTCISKKIPSGVKFQPGVNFTSPTCNMPLSQKTIFNPVRHLELSLSSENCELLKTVKYFRKKNSIIDVRPGSKYASVSRH